LVEKERNSLSVERIGEIYEVLSNFLTIHSIKVENSEKARWKTKS
jgi:hypothetical protein